MILEIRASRQNQEMIIEKMDFRRSAYYRLESDIGGLTRYDLVYKNVLRDIKNFYREMMVTQYGRSI